MVKIKQTDTYSKWYQGLSDLQAAVRVDLRIRRLEMGNPGDVKSVGKGVSELRIDYGPGYRVYFMRRGIELIILLAGGDKKAQKRDIQKALELAREWEE
jgi:putative addiction module killer protein